MNILQMHSTQLPHIYIHRTVQCAVKRGGMRAACLCGNGGVGNVGFNEADV